MDRRYKKKYEKKDLKNWELKHCIECGSKMKIRYGFTVTSPIMGDISYRGYYQICPKCKTYSKPRAMSKRCHQKFRDLTMKFFKNNNLEKTMGIEYPDLKNTFYEKETKHYYSEFF